MSFTLRHLDVDYRRFYQPGCLRKRRRQRVRRRIGIAYHKLVVDRTGANDTSEEGADRDSHRKTAHCHEQYDCPIITLNDFTMGTTVVCLSLILKHRNSSEDRWPDRAVPARAFQISHV